MKANTWKLFLIPVLTIFFLHSTPISAQYSSDIRIDKTNEHYEFGDWIGYSNSRFVNSIAIGTEYIYFATTGGITRYDFYNNTWNFPWTRCNGLASNHVICVAYDEGTNALWCSTPVGVSYYENFSKLWYNIYYENIGIDSDDFVLSIGFSSSDVWLQTASGIYFRKTKNYGYFQNAGTNIFNQQEEILWFGRKAKSEADLPILFMNDGYLFDTQKQITDPNMRHYEVTYYVFDKWGYIWLATWGLGAARADTRTQQMDLLPFGIYQAHATSLVFEDERDRMWIGGWQEDYDNYGSDFREQNGVTLWDREEKMWKYFQSKYISGFDNDLVNRIAIDDSKVWFATERSLNEFLQNRNRWYNYNQSDHLRSNLIYDVAIDDNYVWVATQAGIDRMTKNSIHSDSAEVVRIAFDHLREVEVYDIDLAGDTLWAGTETGAYFYHIPSDSGDFFEGAFGPGTYPVTAVAAAPNAIWFGGENGIDAYDLQKKKWLPRPAQKNIQSRFNDIQATNDVVFVGTDDGVEKYDVLRQYWRHFTVEDGLLSNRVNEIRIRGDYVWFATNEGICQFYWNNPMRID